MNPSQRSPMNYVVQGTDDPDMRNWELRHLEFEMRRDLERFQGRAINGMFQTELDMFVAHWQRRFDAAFPGFHFEVSIRDNELRIDSRLPLPQPVLATRQKYVIVFRHHPEPPMQVLKPGRKYERWDTEI